MTNSWAILIGINYYEHHPERRLKYAVQDARLVGDFLRNDAKFPHDHIISCFGDEKHRNSPTYPTYSNLLKLLTRDFHPGRIGKVERLWFFFAGHGVGRNGQYYLITSDSLEEDIDFKIGLSVEEISACLRQHQNAEIVLVLDSCRQLADRRDFGESISEETIKITQTRGITTIFSCDYGQISYELDFLEQGSFTYALVEGLKKHTLPNQLESHLQKRVLELNTQAQKLSRQIPRIRVEPISKIYTPLLPECVSEADVDELIRLATNAQLFEEDLGKAKELWWQVIEALAISRQKVISARIAIEQIYRNKSTLSPIQENFLTESPVLVPSEESAISSLRSTSDAPVTQLPEQSLPTKEEATPPKTRRQFLQWLKWIGVSGFWIAFFKGCQSLDTASSDAVPAEPISDRTGAPDVTSTQRINNTATQRMSNTVHTITMGTSTQGLVFDPKVLRIKAGDTVKFVVGALPPHNLIFDSAKIPNNDVALAEKLSHKSLVGSGKAFEIIFPADAPPGEYTYFCLPHRGAGMVGKIIVV